eukprot:CAMPEP_0204568150 /NCGR_PEP_ID=MMETSP0661-20131031/37015_1 /ASSEMBLY_ACC=CAM_ASM_000606 /TAXON_ID=109239 /ORGANISM="Alexandrium margalefi, Strain AMGDE01CS-322" /LENGTH=97 /DNA_ID=CAMNT_0051576139 /DNA_START=31 /DNA_END=324 /DNA_ORIENTATION=-
MTTATTRTTTMETPTIAFETPLPVAPPLGLSLQSVVNAPMPNLVGIIRCAAASTAFQHAINLTVNTSRQAHMGASGHTREKTNTEPTGSVMGLGLRG